MKGNLVHAGRIQRRGKGSLYLFLRQITPQTYQWFKEEPPKEETPTSVMAFTIEEALRLAEHTWHQDGFRTVICGFRYTLPERDEHGTNALFHQMVASYSALSGVYFDEELSHNCIVHFASAEALSLYRRLQQEDHL